LGLFSDRRQETGEMIIIPSNQAALLNGVPPMQVRVSGLRCWRQFSDRRDDP
jgi:hypothetical protein